MYTDYEEENNESYYEDDNKKFDKEKLKRIAFIVIASVIFIILIVLLAKGCSNSKNKRNTSYNDEVPTVVVGRESLSLAVGESFNLDADVLLASIANPVIKWYSEDSSVASVNDQGYITAEAIGETNIVALYRQDGKVYRNACKVTVTSNVVTPTSISLGQESVTIKRGGTLLLQVIVTPNDAKVDTLVYSSDDTTIASVDKKGYVHANTVGTTTITVKTSDEKLSSSITVKVVSPSSPEPTPVVINPTGIKIEGLSSGLSVGGKANVIYSVLPSNATNKTVTWRSSNPQVATVSNGVVTGVSAGTCSIIATSSNNLSSQLTVTVQSNKVSVTGVSITGATTISMNVGYTKRLYYTVSPSNATNKAVTFKSSNTNVIIVDSNGIMAAVGKGTALVSITTKDGGKTAIANVTVTDPNGGTSGGGSSSTGGGGSVTPTSSDECSVDSVIIKSNQEGAITSNLRFENAKAFTNADPGLYVTSYDSCLKSATYSMWYNASKDKLNTSISATASGSFPKKGETLYLNKGNGYYYIKVNLVSKAGNSYSKNYYAIVNGSTNPSGSRTENGIAIGYTRTCSGTKGTFKITASNPFSYIKKFSYCFTNSLLGCPSTSYKAVYNNSNGVKTYTTTVTNTNNNNLICLSATSKDGSTNQTCFPNIKCS